MFETVVPAGLSSRSRKAFFLEALPFSVAVHAAAGVAALAASVWTVAFPSNSPAQIASFMIADAPPPPPPPPPPAAAKARPIQPAALKIDEIVAPTVIPDRIPDSLPEMVVVEFVEEGLPEGIAGGIPGGVLGGLLSGVAGGTVGGTPGGVIGGVGEGVVQIERDKPLPMYALSQTYPAYPEDARIRSWEDEMVVRYVIGRDGRVKEVSVVKPPEREVFIKGTLRAIRSWRFRPMIKDGQRQEVIHELTVFYRLNA